MTDISTLLNQSTAEAGLGLQRIDAEFLLAHCLGKTRSWLYAFSDQPPLSCPITAYAGVDDKEARGDELAAWCVHTSSAFDHRVFPGSHFFLQSSRAALLADVSATLSAAITDMQRVREPGR